MDLLHALIFLLPTSPPQQPLISEFMASNEDTLEDQDGDSSDWIEIHNPLDQALDVGGWYLTDNAQKPKKWQFPTASWIDAGGFLVLFASEKDRYGDELHTNFKLSAGGEYLALVSPAGVPIDEYFPGFPEQFTDVSYGREFTDSGAGSFSNYFLVPSPGAANGTGGPAIVDPQFSPVLPRDGEPVLVTARIHFAPGVSPVETFLRYRVMFYDPVRIELTDDGTGSDATAGDGVYSASIPGGLALPRQMLRWLLRAKDDRGGESRLPTFVDLTDSPEYFGTIVEDPLLSSQLPVYHWFVKNPDKANNRSGARSSLWYNGRFYDNLLVHLRGGSSAGLLKHPYKFDFNHGDKFVWNENAPPVDEINVNSTWSDKAFIRQVLAFETYRDTGVHGSSAFPLRLQQNGEFFSVAIFVEEPEEELLERLGMDPDGALYKMYNEFTSATAGVEKKTREWEGNADLDEMVKGVQSTGDPLDRLLFDRLDVPRVVSYMAATVLMHDNDHVAKNYLVYRDSEGDGEWEFVPWDKDLTFGRNYTGEGGVLNDTMWANDDPMSHPYFGDREHPKVDGPWNRLIDACLRSPRIRVMYLRTLRSAMDQLLRRNSDPEQDRPFDVRCEELYQRMQPDAELDEAKWGVPNWGDPLDFRQGLDQLKDYYLRPRRWHLYQTHFEGGIIPDAQRRAHLRFGAIETSPPSGDPTEQYVQLVNEHAESVDLSGWRLVGDVDFVFTNGSVIPPHDSAFVSPNLPAFRARAQSPRGGEMNLVLGPFLGRLETSHALALVDTEGIVVATTGSPVLSTAGFEAGRTARVATAGVDPGECVAVLWSVTGPGPLDTPIGPLALSCPLYLLGLQVADVSGVAEFEVPIPPEAAGLPVWLQGIAIEHKCLTNGVEVRIPGAG